MNNLIVKKIILVIISLSIVSAADVVAAGLRSIKKRIYEKEYTKARKEIQSELKKMRGRSLIEGKMILASNIPGCKEIILDKELLFEVRNSIAIVKTIRGILELTESEKEKIAKEQLKFIKNNFNRDIITNKYMNFRYRACHT